MDAIVRCLPWVGKSAPSRTSGFPALDADVTRLSKAKAGQVVTAKRILIGVVVVLLAVGLVLIVSASRTGGREHNASAGGVQMAAVSSAGCYESLERRFRDIVAPGLAAVLKVQLEGPHLSPATLEQFTVIHSNSR